MTGSRHKPYICHNEETAKDPDPVTPLQTSPENPIFPAGNLMHIISQLCSITNDTLSEAQQSTAALCTGHPLLLTLTRFFLLTLSKKEPNPAVFNDSTSSDKEYQAICDILDQLDILDDCTNIDGCYDVSAPFAFAAGTQNNMDILFSLRMLKADH
jgi:hypothetical protein